MTEMFRALFKYKNKENLVVIIDLKIGRSLKRDHVYEKEKY